MSEYVQGIHTTKAFKSERATFKMADMTTMSDIEKTESQWAV